ncbi:MAG: hypothetical protein ABIZ04_03830 [Opitutus sp.]
MKPISPESLFLVPAPTNTRKSKVALSASSHDKLIRARIRALEIPPIKDGLVIGKDAAIGGEAMTRTLRLMTNEKFDRLVLKDDIIQEIIVRTAVLRKIGQTQLVSFVLDRVKPIMHETELLMLDIEVELVIEGTI